MSTRTPILWTIGGPALTGAFEAAGGRFLLSARDRAFEAPVDSVVGARIERAKTQRIRGLPVLALTLSGGGTVRIASLGGAGSLHDLAEFAAPQLLGSGA